MRENFVLIRHVSNLIPDFRTQLLPSLPGSLRRISLSDTYVELHSRTRPVHIAFSVQDTAFAKALAKSCLNLREFSASAPAKVNCDAFLRELVKTRCNSLMSLCLTCPLLHTDTHQDLITHHMVIAAQAAESLPALRIMELWSASPSHACLFQFKLVESTPTITLMQTGMEFEIECSARKAWERVASTNKNHRPLRVVVKPFPDPPERIAATSGLCILHHLSLGELALAPTTLAHSKAVISLYKRASNSRQG